MEEPVPLLDAVQLKHAGYDPCDFCYDPDWLYSPPPTCPKAALRNHSPVDCERCFLNRMPVKKRAGDSQRLRGRRSL